MNITVVHTPTNDLEQSKDFYSRLKFRQLDAGDKTVFTDGKAVVEINPDRYARAGLKIYTDSADGLRNDLEPVSELVEIDGGFCASDPNGVRIYVSTEEPGFEFQPGEESFGITGNFAGLSIEAHSVGATAAFWEAAGFTKSAGDLEQGWASFSNGIDISIMKPMMCPHLFFNPGMTYFNGGKNLTNIGLIREAGIPIVEEITHFSSDGVADNIIIRDPGGYGFFVFND